MERRWSLYQGAGREKEMVRVFKGAKVSRVDKRALSSNCILSSRGSEEEKQDKEDRTEFANLG